MKSFFLVILLALLSAFEIFSQRIVSLIPSATYTLQQIEADDLVVGRTSYCPPSINGKGIVVGDAINVSMETIVALRPTHVLASVFTKKATTEKLQSMGIEVVCMPTPQNFVEICHQTIELGKMAGKVTEAEKLIRVETAKVDSISQSTNDRGLRAYVQVGAKPLWGATPDYYLSDMLSKIYLQNVLKDGEGACSREEITVRRPDIIIISSMGGLGRSEQKIWRKTSTALSMVIDESELSCTTPSHYRIAMQHIADFVRKNEKKMVGNADVDATTGATRR